MLSALTATLLALQLQIATLQLAQVAHADTVQLPPSFVLDPSASIQYWASKYSVDSEQMETTLRCESKLNPKAVGLAGEIGVAQILPRAHPDVTKQQMEDPDWSVQWMAQQFAIGNEHIWTCWRAFYGS